MLSRGLPENAASLASLEAARFALCSRRQLAVCCVLRTSHLRTFAYALLSALAAFSALSFHLIASPCCT